MAIESTHSETAQESLLCFVCEKRSEDRVWGVYRRRSVATDGEFFLATMVFDFDESVRRAKNLKDGFPDAEFGVLGAPGSAELPERYTHRLHGGN